MILEDLAGHFERQGVTRDGVDLFIGSMPADVKIGVLLRDPPAGLPIDQELIGYRRGRYVVSVRHTNYPDGRELANRIVQALYVDGEGWPSVKILRMRPVTEPMVFPVSTADQIEWSVLFEVSFVSNP